jgi:hypothetical protein
MAFYVYAWRDVRNQGAADQPAGTKDAPRKESTVRYFTVQKVTDPLAADLLIPLKDTFSNIDATDPTAYSAMATAAATASTSANRANDAITVASLRWGKSVLQFGIGYHASNPTTAYGAINWKNL